MVDWEAASSIDVGVGEEEFPGAVEVEPALAAEPAGGQRWNVEQGVSSHADHLGAVPAEEGARGQADGGRVGDAAQADRASFALIGDGPAESEETDGEAPEELEALGERRIADGAAVRKIERRGEADGCDEQRILRRRNRTRLRRCFIDGR